MGNHYENYSESLGKLWGNKGVLQGNCMESLWFGIYYQGGRCILMQLCNVQALEWALSGPARDCDKELMLRDLFVSCPDILQQEA